jgi:hypothetical protein
MMVWYGMVSGGMIMIWVDGWFYHDVMGWLGWMDGLGHWVEVHVFARVERLDANQSKCLNINTCVSCAA